MLALSPDLLDFKILHTYSLGYMQQCVVTMHDRSDDKQISLFFQTYWSKVVAYPFGNVSAEINGLKPTRSFRWSKWHQAWTGAAVALFLRVRWVKFVYYQHWSRSTFWTRATGAEIKSSALRRNGHGRMLQLTPMLPQTFYLRLVQLSSQVGCFD